MQPNCLFVQPSVTLHKQISHTPLLPSPPQHIFPALPFVHIHEIRKGPSLVSMPQPQQEPAGRRLSAEMHVILTLGRRGQTINLHLCCDGKKSPLKLLGSCWGNMSMEVNPSIRLVWRPSLASRHWVVVCLFRSRERPSLVVIASWIHSWVIWSYS